MSLDSYSIYGLIPLLVLALLGCSTTPTPTEPTAASSPVEVDVLYNADGTIIYAAEGNLCLWDGSGSPIFLTSAARVHNVSLSSDGAIVAFVRRLFEYQMEGPRELLAVNRDGTNERVLVSREDFAAISSYGSGMTTIPYQMIWIRDTHRLLYNTGGTGQSATANYDLRLVDADTLYQTTILHPGEGGAMRPSPDAEKIGLVTPERIFIVDADGTSPRGELQFAVTPSFEYPYVPQSAWTPDSSSLVAIVGAQALENMDAGWDVWRIPADGAEPILLHSIPEPEPDHFIRYGNTVFLSPDLTRIAYVSHPAEDPSQAELHVARLDGSEDVVYFAGEFSFLRWESDSEHFIIRLAYDATVGYRQQRGGLGEDLEPFQPAPTPTLDLPLGQCRAPH